MLELLGDDGCGCGEDGEDGDCDNKGFLLLLGLRSELLSRKDLCFCRLFEEIELLLLLLVLFLFFLFFLYLNLANIPPSLNDLVKEVVL